MKKALVNDFYYTNGGSEKCIRSFVNIWEDLEVYSLIDYLSDKDLQDILKGKSVHTSFLQYFPFIYIYYRFCLPLLPKAIESFDLSTYDLILSSSYAVAKGVRKHSQQLHICYCHTPMRYVWAEENQFTQSIRGNRGLLRPLINRMLMRFKAWDLRTADRVDHFIANSQFIAERIRRAYGRESTVIYPPVDVDRFTLQTQKEDFYLTASRLVPYKRLDLVVEAFNTLNKKLIVIGEGPQLKLLKKMATSANIEFLGHQDRSQIVNYMQRAKAFVFPALEDFGILPVEAQACGTPVICLGKGGTLETVVHGKTDVHFAAQTSSAIHEAVTWFEQNQNLFDPTFIRRHAEKFSRQRFEREMKEFVEGKVKK